MAAERTIPHFLMFFVDGCSDMERPDKGTGPESDGVFAFFEGQQGGMVLLGGSLFWEGRAAEQTLPHFLMFFVDGRSDMERPEKGTGPESDGVFAFFEGQQGGMVLLGGGGGRVAKKAQKHTWREL